jgi:hypothetical protein
MLILNCQCKNNYQFMFPLRPQKGARTWLSFKNHHIQNNVDHSHLQVSTPYRVLLSFQFWIATPKGKSYMVKNFWLNIWMISSKCSINQFFNLIFIKVSVKKNYSFSIEPFTWTIASLGDLMYSWIFCSKIQDEKRFSIAW